MVQSINTKAEFVVKGTSHLGMTDYGQIMVGDRGFEFFADNSEKNFIQIPWEEVDSVIASIIFGGRWIPRFAIKTKRNGTYSFSARDPKAVLRAIRVHVGAENIVKSLSFFQVIGRGFKNLFSRFTKKKSN
ncbi:DUF956 family protein [Pediococcus argentinicus]|uniref:ManO protein n=1 Tax=Pediococcus argentinicus TaxID=480391 RepID=A0A0R2N8D4_9LACO|nr:DUF956 family protein [Pediococcus argentinicus]KRO21436.1 hypothetical protein IV88_GL001365 [Pediococcus argentinicus]NKZ23135.1 DUF956 family protein [Pediococcus argentinicus]GEP20286.1 hypothetical protein LSA03_16700 [Pediococcus argentinicus]